MSMHTQSMFLKTTIASLNLTNKVVHQYKVDSGKCHVKILDLCIPSEASH